MKSFNLANFSDLRTEREQESLFLQFTQRNERKYNGSKNSNGLTGCESGQTFRREIPGVALP